MTSNSKDTIQDLAVKLGDASPENQLRIFSALVRFCKDVRSNLDTDLPDWQGTLDNLSPAFWKTYGELFMKGKILMREVLEPHINTLKLIQDNSIRTRIVESAVGDYLNHSEQ